MRLKDLSADRRVEPLRFPAAQPPKAGRLHSWKEIAAHLKHSVRTVQRWESEGLPIRRHPHEKRDSVYAYPEELDAWWEKHHSLDSGQHPFPIRTVRKPERSVWIAMTGLVVLAAGGGWYLHRAPRPASGGRFTLLVSSANLTFDPAISPDGKMIAYGAEVAGQTDLYVSPVAGGERIRLTNDPARETKPRFSPDGARLLFKRVGAPDTVSEVCMVSVLGGTATRLIAAAADGAWSPDGGRIAFISKRANEQEALAVAASDGLGIRVILRGDATYPFLRNPAWSPDGTKLAVERSTGGIAGELWLAPLNGGAPRRISRDPAGVFSRTPIFAPDGRGLIHQSNRGGALNLWSLPLDGGKPRQLTSGPGPDESPSVARNGAIAFESTHERSALIVHELATGQTRELLTHTSYIWAPVFSPDGRDLAFSRAEPGGAWHIWITPVGGGDGHRLTSGPIPEVYPRFSPDGTSIIFHTWSPSGNRIWRVPRGGGAPVPLTPPRKEDDAYGDLSPDGRWLAFARTENDITRLYVAPVSGGQARRVTETVATVPRWSPDGRWIAFSPNRGFTGGIFVVGSDGAGTRRLTNSGSFPVWWPDGKQVAYMDLGPDGVQQILMAPAGGGQPKPLGSIHFQGANNPFDISPDGKLLASSTVVGVSSEIWLLEPATRPAL